LGFYDALFPNDELDEGCESSDCRTWHDDHRNKHFDSCMAGFLILQELAGFLGAAPGSGIDSRLRKSIEPPRRVTLDYDAKRP
jgi:hypothetical protein